MREDVKKLLKDMAEWRAAAPDRSPANHHVLQALERLLRGRGPEARQFGRRLELAWAERSFGAFYERPLLLLAALRFDALRGGRSHPLWSVLAEPQLEPNVSQAALTEAFSAESVWISLRSRFVQTNETSRAVTWLWPAALAGCGVGRPLALVEIGTAAGLNLVADRLPAIWTDQSGAELPIVAALPAARKVGIDVRPLDVGDDEAVEWMRACIWAGEDERIARFDAAIEAFRRAAPELMTGDAVAAPDALRRITAEAPADALVLAFQTIVRDYLDHRADAAYEHGMRAFIAASAPRRAAWLELELERPASDRAHPAVVRAHFVDTFGEIVDVQLARTSYHPAELIVDRDAVALFQRFVGAAN